MQVFKLIVRNAWLAVQTLLKAGLLLCIPALLLLLNREVTADKQSRINQLPRDNALALLSGKALASGDQLNERELLAELILQMEEPFDTIALGSSRVQQVTANIAGTDSFYNAGLSGADYRDVMNIFYLLDKADKLPSNLIIGLDPWLLNGDPNMLHPGSDAELFEEFITLKLGYETGWTPAPEPDPPSPMAPFKPDVIWDNLDYYFSMDELPAPTPPNVAEGNLEIQHTQLKMADGSVLYPLSFRMVPQDTVDHRARVDAVSFLRMDDFVAPDSELCLLLERFVAYARSRNVNVIFLLAPYHPLVYNWATERAQLYPGFFLTEPWFTQFAQQHNIPLYGSYNPFVLGCFTDEFYDGLHAKGDALKHIFPGVPAVLAAQSNGVVEGPWLRTGPRVQYDVAQRLVVERYEIYEPEVVRQGPDDVIHGETCYVVQRFADDGEAAIMLAQYAVTQSEGVVYRLDTLAMEWVVDSRFPEIPDDTGDAGSMEEAA